MRTSALHVIALLVMPSLASAASFTPLGYLAGGNLASHAFAVSYDGAVVVGYDYGESSEAWRWTGGVMIGLGGVGSQAYGVSADGAVAVGITNRQAFRWTGGVMTGLGYLPFKDHFSQANGISADGAVVVGVSSASLGSEGFLWTGGVMTGLGFLPGDTASRATNVSADGTVVVGTSSGAPGYEAFRWTGGVMTGLGFLPGGIYSHPDSVSADGTVIVGQATSALGTQAFRWTGGVMTGLGDLPGGIFQSEATGVSADGSVVVGNGSSPGIDADAFVWTEANGMERLCDVLVANGATGLTGWTLVALGISGDGHWVVGYGDHPNGSREAFLANISPSIPPAAAVDDGPIAVTEGIAQVISVGTNDTGFTDPVTVTVTTQPTKGTITAISPPGPAAGMTITYTANIGSSGSDSFVYDMTDNTPASDSATVTLTISPNPDYDGDGVENDFDNCPNTANADQSDTDEDGRGDVCDNCTLVVNTLAGNVPGSSPPIPRYQLDADHDGYGNACDGDLNNNGATNSQDYVLFRGLFGAASPGYNKADLNANGVVNSQDYVLFRGLLGSSPGPSGLACAGIVPCP